MCSSDLKVRFLGVPPLSKFKGLETFYKVSQPFFCVQLPSLPLIGPSVGRACYDMKVSELSALVNGLRHLDLLAPRSIKPTCPPRQRGATASGHPSSLSPLPPYPKDTVKRSKGQPEVSLYRFGSSYASYVYGCYRARSFCILKLVIFLQFYNSCIGGGLCD